MEDEMESTTGFRVPGLGFRVSDISLNTGEINGKSQENYMEATVYSEIWGCYGGCLPNNGESNGTDNGK